MQKKEAIDIISKCSKEYKNNLENKNLLFIFGTSSDKNQFEATFLGRNYLHLTGVIPTLGRFSSAYDFYRTCIYNKLAESDFSFANDGTTELKLSILMRIMNIHNTAKMVGEYNSSKTLLYTEKIAGNIFGCMGFVREGEFYIPNTVIKEDIRDVTIRPQQRMLAILRKDISEKEYKHVTYLAKGISVEKLGFSQANQLGKINEKKETERKPLEEQLREAKKEIGYEVVQIHKKQIRKNEQIR